MLTFIIISLMYYEGACFAIPIPKPIYSPDLIECVSNIIADYFAPRKVITYVGIKQDSNDFLRAIHNLDAITLVSRHALRKLPVPHEGYFISAKNHSILLDGFPHLLKESTWNPVARFLIVIRSLEKDHLPLIFNMLLKFHVNKVIVVNATADADLYTYNPFDNFGCGKSYDNIISYGKCSQAYPQHLYSDKFNAKLHNCTFTMAIPDWPPYTIFPPRENDTSTRYAYGIEPYLLRLIGEMTGFSWNIILNKNLTVSYSRVSTDMVASGVLNLIQKHKADAVVGGLLLVPSRAVAFSYIYDLLPYVDEIRFVVKRAGIVPAWKNSYKEFEAIVWILIILALLLYAALMVILLRGKNKGIIVFKLMDSLLGHACKIQYQSTLRTVFIIWIWFAFLINAFYQSILVSLTTHPAQENQISTEADILKHKLKPCFSYEMESYYGESAHWQTSNVPGPDCHTAEESFEKVVNSKDYYTIYLYGIFNYHIHDYKDIYGNVLLYPLKEPFSKVIYSMYFYKGFPLIDVMRVNALRLREIGLVDKAMSDMNYLMSIKYHYRARPYQSYHVMPWFIYIIGCTTAAITLMLEKLSK